MKTCRNPQHGAVCDCPAEFQPVTSQRYCCTACREHHYSVVHPQWRKAHTRRRRTGKRSKTVLRDAEACALLGRLIYASVNGRSLNRIEADALLRFAGYLIDLEKPPNAA